MISLIAMLLGALALGWAAQAWVAAVRAEHLVVLRLSAGRVLLARQGDGRYEITAAPGVPLALARFEAGRVAQRAREIRAAMLRPFHRQPRPRHRPVSLH